MRGEAKDAGEGDGRQLRPGGRLMERRRRFAVGGLTASGKSTVAQLLCRPGEEPHHLISPFRELCAEAGIAGERDTLVAVTAPFRSIAGPAVLAQIAIERGCRVVEGLRFGAEAVALKYAGYVIVYVDTPAELRAYRRRQRGERGVAPLEEEAAALKDFADVVVPGHTMEGFLGATELLLRRGEEGVSTTGPTAATVST